MMKQLRITKRTKFVTLLSITTLGCFIAGIACYSHWLGSSIRDTVSEQVVKDNIQIAKQLVRFINEMKLQNVRNGDSWVQMQNIVEDIKLPNQGFVCIVDSSSGLLICHPEMRKYPKLKKVAVGKCPINVENCDYIINTSMQGSSDSVAGGIANIKGERQVVAVANISNQSANLLVHQRISGIDQSVAGIMWYVNTIGYAVAIIFTGLVFAVNYTVINCYENKLITLNEQLEHTVQRRTLSLKNTRNSVIFGLAKLAESRDNDTGQHLERISIFVAILAKRLSNRYKFIDATYIEDLALASSLHDIGKVGIPDQVLLKPGRFNEEERAIMNKHSTIGGDCLKAIQKQLGEDGFLSMAEEIAYFHHEKWDGTGYPTQLSGNSIPLSARIVALADVYDALTSKRPYKEAMSHNEARDIILEGRGRHFDPNLIDAFLESEEEFATISSSMSQEEATLSSIEKLSEELGEMNKKSISRRSKAGSCLL